MKGTLRWLFVIGIVTGLLTGAHLPRNTSASGQANTEAAVFSPMQTKTGVDLPYETVVDGSSIDRVAEEGMKRYDIPGMAIGIVKNGRIVYLKGYGRADQAGRRVTPQTPFMLGSVSKSFTALAIMQLAERGLLELDKEAAAYLPGMRISVPASGRGVTVRDLLQHTSGISSYDGLTMLNIEGQLSEEVVKRHFQLRAARLPGTFFQYSNANYMLLGAIVEQVSGMSYPKYMEAYIFKPLQMINSYALPTITERYADFSADVSDMADGYQRLFGRLIATKWPVRPLSVPAGYLAASAEDVTHYMMAQMEAGRYGDVQLLSREGMEAMHRRSAGIPYGMGWFLSPAVISHGGDAENFHADIIMLPDSGWGIVVMMNTNDVWTTSVYGNVYEALSYHILQTATEGQAFPAGLPDMVQPGPIAYWMNALIALLALWALWAVLRLGRKRNNCKGIYSAISIKVVWILMADFVLPISFLLGFTHMQQAPWETIMRFMPGWGHALFIIPIVLLGVGILETAIATWTVWRWRR